ncbi:hypothetical protein CCZ01_03185 [Helicobacter monodelphidis]|uniref:hypothetical protein n=1 Tax=Helicobacter sp. 15-1451 TaxID=2004995 RepID=UPI000DCEAD81|nr:hypothetical protein [Helicobacter sp. 15-1451]RAX58434.1 hypothetical protein CCZ01_03185 [Helicobacter sp. 15-1451]
MSLKSLFAECMPSLLPKILYLKINNNRLHICVKHPAYKSEINYNLNTIREILKMTKGTHFGDLSFIEHIDISVVYHQQRQEEYIEEKCFIESAEGEFKNNAKNPRIHKIFEEMREQIFKIHRLSQCEFGSHEWRINQ